MKVRSYGMWSKTGQDLMDSIKKQKVYMYSEESVIKNEEINFLNNITIANAQHLFTKIKHRNLKCTGIMVFKDERDQLHSMHMFDYFDITLNRNDSLIVYDHTSKEEPDILYSDVIFYSTESLQETMIEFECDISNIEDAKRALRKEEEIETKNVA